MLGGHGTLMSTAGMSNSTVGGGNVGAPPGGSGVGVGSNGGLMTGNGIGGGGVGVGGHHHVVGQQNSSTLDSRAVSVVVTLPGGPGSQHPGQALSDYGPI